MICLEIEGLKINYLDYGIKDKQAVVLLHGWGQNIAMMQMIGEALKYEYRIIIIDFPGFGLSDEPKEAIGIDGYTARAIVPSGASTHLEAEYPLSMRLEMMLKR